MVLPVVIFLVMGIIDTAVVLADLNVAREGARAGARSLSTGRVADDVDGCTLVGSGFSTDDEAALCRLHQVHDLSASRTRVRIEMPDDAAVGDDLTVCIQHEMASLTGGTGAMLDGRVLTSEVAMRIEIAYDGMQAVSETSFDGSDWDWCGL